MILFDMYYKKNITFILLFLSALSNFSYSIDNQDFINYKLNVILDNDNKTSIKSIAEDEIVRGTIYGKIDELDNKYFSNSSLECDFIGRSYKGRGFSCGFAIVEDLQGFCYIKNLDGKNTLITSWKCNTTAGIGGDAKCVGKLNIVQGVGLFAGVSGFGKISMPLAKSFIDNKLSNLMTMKLKIKYPLSLTKN